MNSRTLLISILPSVIIALWVYYHDRYEREPFYLLIKTFILGALTIIPALFIERFLVGLNIFPGLLGDAYVAFVVAGFIEEYFKRWVVLRTIYHNKEFNEKLDGIAYSVYSALGFATVENIMYIANNIAMEPLVGFYRGIFSVPAHTMFGITMGYYLSLAKFSKDGVERRKFLSKSLWIPVILHGIFNYILLSKLDILMILFIPFVLYLWIINIKKIRLCTKESQWNSNGEK